MLMKILMIILGILTVCDGIYVTANPGMALPLLGGLMAVGLFLFSLAALVKWFHWRRKGRVDMFSLIIAILSLIFSLMFLGNIWAQILSAEMMFYMEMIFSVVIGIILVVQAIRLRSIGSVRATANRLGESWGLVLVAGILMVIAGLFSLSHPMGAIAARGVIMGIEIIVTGVAAIVAGIALKVPD